MTKTHRSAMVALCAGTLLVVSANGVAERGPQDTVDTIAAHCYHPHHAHWLKAPWKARAMHYGSDIHHLAILDLSDEQRRQIDRISEGLNERLSALETRRQEAATQLPELYAASQPDPVAIGDVYAEIFDSKRERIEGLIEARNRILATLTDEQRAALDRFTNGHGRGMPL